MDTSTGLLYMGSGQYYDPTTGRFLNRNAKPDQTNPYVPWGGEPTGALFTPLALLSLLYSRRKKRGTLDIIIILVVLSMSLGLSLTACGSNNGPTTTPVNTPTGPGTVTATPTPSGVTVTITTPPPAGSPVGTPSATCTITLTPGPTSTLSNSDVLNIYTWAGLETQSGLLLLNTRSRIAVYTYDIYKAHTDPRYTGIGIAKVTDMQMETPTNVRIPCPSPDEKKTCGVGLGLRTTVHCNIFCPASQDQDTDSVATTAMQTRISLRTEKCLNNGCTATDEFLVAALAENESMNPQEVETAINKDKLTPPPVIINWQKWLGPGGGAGEPKDISKDLSLISQFKGYVGNRSDLGVDWGYVDTLLQNP